MQDERLVYYTAGNISMRITDDPRLVAVTPGRHGVRHDDARGRS